MQTMWDSHSKERCLHAFLVYTNKGPFPTSQRDQTEAKLIIAEELAKAYSFMKRDPNYTIYQDMDISFSPNEILLFALKVLFNNGPFPISEKDIEEILDVIAAPILSEVEAMINLFLRFLENLEIKKADPEIQAELLIKLGGYDLLLKAEKGKGNNLQNFTMDEIFNELEIEKKYWQFFEFLEDYKNNQKLLSLIFSPCYQKMIFLPKVFHKKDLKKMIAQYHLVEIAKEDYKHYLQIMKKHNKFDFSSPIPATLLNDNDALIDLGIASLREEFDLLSFPTNYYRYLDVYAKCVNRQRGAEIIRKSLSYPASIIIGKPDLK